MKPERARANRILHLYEVFEGYQSLGELLQKHPTDIGQDRYLAVLDETSAYLIEQSYKSANQLYRIRDLGYE